MMLYYRVKHTKTPHFWGDVFIYKSNETNKINNLNHAKKTNFAINCHKTPLTFMRYDKLLSYL